MDDEITQAEIQESGLPKYCMPDPAKKDAGLARMKSEFEAYSESSHYSVMESCVAGAALDGDVAATAMMARMTLDCITLGETMSPALVRWLSHALARVVMDKRVALAVSNQTNRKGPPSKAFHSLQTALAVQAALMEDGGPTSVENAWVQVAADLHQSVASVKKSWTEWKPKLKEAWQAGGGFVPGFEETIRDQIKANRTKRKPKQGK